MGDGAGIRCDAQGRRWIAPADLDSVVEQARAEAWADLTFVGPGWHGAPEPRVFHLTDHAPALIARLAPLTELSSLTLVHHASSAIQVGRMVLWSYQHDEDGVRALRSLTALTTLNLRGTSLKRDGVRAVAALDRLTSLELELDRVDGVEDARPMCRRALLASVARRR